MSVPNIVGVKPAGSQVLVEHLTEGELMNSTLVLTGPKKNSPQAYVLAMGPALNPDTVGFKVGDRVIIVGNYNPVPHFDDNPRELGIVDPHAIRAVLIEESKIVVA